MLFILGLCLLFCNCYALQILHPTSCLQSDSKFTFKESKPLTSAGVINKKRVLLRVPLTRNVPAINEVTVLSSFGSSYHINAKECYLYFKKAFATNTC
ncbi:hypothetical protein T08_16460 [Trichinella sp. T8]|nr:hypothetical protein T08_16460 [Trichinella sp. T8]